MNHDFSCCLLDGMQRGEKIKVCPKHRYHKMACSMVYSNSLLTNVYKTWFILSFHFHRRLCFFGVGGVTSADASWHGVCPLSSKTLNGTFPSFNRSDMTLHSTHGQNCTLQKWRGASCKIFGFSSINRRDYFHRLVTEITISCFSPMTNSTFNTC